MKNSMFLIVFIMIIFLSLFSSVYADVDGVVNCTLPLRVRSSIDTSSISNILVELNEGDSVTVLSTNAGSNASCSTWYQIKVNKNSNTYTGYTCGEFITISNSNTTLSSDNIYVKANYDKYVNGDGTVACYEDTSDWKLMSSLSGTYDGAPARCGDVVKINETRDISSGNCRYYYNVTDTKGNTGWLCGYYVITNKLSSTANNYYNNNGGIDSYYNTLRGLGFPESYLPYLAEIHARHPNWKFESEKINIDFGEVVSNEALDGRSLLEGSAFNNNYFSTNSSTYNIYNDTFYDDANEKGYYNASTEAIAFYMDPRNYLNEKYIFAFETLNFKSNQNVATVSSILSKQSFWGSVYNGYESNVSEDVYKASSSIGVSAVHIASRIKQEISGISPTDPRLGGTFTYDKVNYSGYYNFYNIGVSGENKIVKGMMYAKNNGWNTPYNGIYGGASFIYNNYVANNQDTMYYEKFDVSRSSGKYTHQYMQNLAAPIQETDIKFKSYLESVSSYYNSDITFTIPVYNNMSNYPVTSPKLGNPNNFLKLLSVNDNSVSGFSYDNYNYSISVPDGTTSIKVGASTINSKATLRGVGNVSINKDTKSINVIVTSESGKERTYTINISFIQGGERITLNTIMNSSGVKYNDSTIFGIGENTNVGGLINNIKNTSVYSAVNVYDKNNNPKNNDIFKTGDKVVVSNGETSKTYNVVIYGDINGDGIIDKLDYLAVLRLYYGYTSYDGVYKTAADANHDGKVDKLDYLAILRDYYGYASVNQE